MSKPKHILLLEVLEHEGVGYAIDISKWLYDNFVLHQTEYEFNREVDAVDRFIDDLVEREYIGWEKDENEMDRCYLPKFDHNSETQDWFQILPNTDITLKNFVYLKSAGLDYLDLYRSAQLSKKANLAIIITLFATVIFSLSTLVVSYWSYGTSKSAYQLGVKNASSDSISSINVSKRLDTLQSMLRSLQQSLSSPKVQKTSPQQKHP